MTATDIDNRSFLRAAGRYVAVAVAGVAAAGCAFDVSFDGRLGPGLLPYLAAVGDVTHGRTPLVDTASRGGWGAIDALSAILSGVSLGYGPLALAVSGAAAVCALTMLALALSAVRARAPALTIGCAAIVVATLAGPLPDSGAPSSGAMTLLLPFLGALAAVHGAGARSAADVRLLRRPDGRDRRGWHRVALACCFVGGLWSLPAAVLTVLAVAAGPGARQGETNRRPYARCARAAAGGLLVYACAALVRSGTPADPRVLLASAPFARSPGDPEPGLGGTMLGLAALLGAALAWRASRRDSGDASPRAAAARRALTALAVPIAVHGLLTGAAVEIAHAAGLAVLLVGVIAQHRGRRGAAAFATACLVAVACAGATISARWHDSALYAAIPHEPFDALGIAAGSFDQSLRYDLRVLASGPELAPYEIADARPLAGGATRRGDRLLVLLPGAVQAELLASLHAASMLPTGDPTTSDIVGELRSRLLRAIDALPEGARLLTSAAWLAAPADGDGAEHAAVQALALVRRHFTIRVLVRRSGLVLTELHKKT